MVKELELRRRAESPGPECKVCKSPAIILPWPEHWLCSDCCWKWTKSDELAKSLEPERESWKNYYSHEFEERRDGKISPSAGVTAKELMLAFMAWFKAAERQRRDENTKAT